MSPIESSEFNMDIEPRCQGTGTRKRTIEHRWNEGTFKFEERNTEYTECQGCEDCKEE